MPGKRVEFANNRLPGIPSSYARICQIKESLPIFSARERIIQHIKDHNITILLGETGSGKTTQLPQYLLQGGLVQNGKMIGVTQPRRVAALSIAKRVAEEMQTKLGDKVGYSIRFDDKTSSHTRIKYMTDGMLLREWLSDPLMKQYSIIILDEAHERTLRTDILFSMVKQLQKTNRPDLKIVIMSATLDADKFSRYFNNASVLYIHGRQFPVRTFYSLSPVSDILDGTLTTILQLHLEQPPGDVLVFLPGQEEIERLEEQLNEYTSAFPPESEKMLILTLFAAMPSNQQALVFEPAPLHTRKVILATNIAETSITITGIRYVVDPGLVKEKQYDSRIGTELLTTQAISRAQARQRAGRAGREAPGICYRLFTEDSFYGLEEETLPEILRCNLASAVLTLKACKIEDILHFDFMDPPSKDALIHALEQLYALGALDDAGKLTLLGSKMAEFPLDPAYSKVLIQSKEMHCSKEIVALISLLSVENVYFTPHAKLEEANEAKRKFMSNDGDHWTLLNVWKDYLEAYKLKESASWCVANFINARAMKHVMAVHKQLLGFCHKMAIPMESCENDKSRVAQCMLAGFFQKTAVLQPDGRTYKTLVAKHVVSIHPSSVLCQRKRPFVVFNELVFTKAHYMRTVSEIDPSWLPSVAPRYFGRFLRETDRLNAAVA